MKPLDHDMIKDLAEKHEVLLTVEEGSIGGFGSHVLESLSEMGCLDNGLKVRTLSMPDVFVDHDKPAVQNQKAGLDALSILLGKQ